MFTINEVLSHKRFIGLWTYRPYSGNRKYCCTILICAEVQETEMHDTWQSAVGAAGALLEETANTE